MYHLYLADTTPARPKPGRGLKTVGCMMTRKFRSGTEVFVGNYKTPDGPRPSNGGLCIWWSDGTVTSADPSLCPPRDTLGRLFD